MTLTKYIQKSIFKTNSHLQVKDSQAPITLKV